MSRPRLEVADIFRAHGPAYRSEHARHLNLPQLKVMSAIENCRTAGIGDGVDIVLEHDLLRRMLEPHRRQPAPVGDRPALLSGIDAAVAQQKSLKMLPRLAEHLHRRRSRSDQIAHRLVRGIRHPHRRQLAGTVQFRQHHRVAVVRLHPVVRLYGDERRRNHDAVMPQINELAVQAIAARPGLVAEMQTDAVSAELLHQLLDMIGPMRDRPSVPHLAATFPLYDCDGNRRLVDIQPNESTTLHAVSPHS